MRQLAKSILKRCLPGQWFVTMQSIRSRNWQKRFAKERGLDTVGMRVAALAGNRVMSGPFADMILGDETIRGRASAPHLFGSYEKELHEILAGVGEGGYEEIWDVGCAFGHYVVGLALLCPWSKVVGFDCEPGERQVCMENARAVRTT
jgi:hypothetical protein